ncbi:3D-(3,5/4)-trihydroxycyclohexane-1,2-dione acylhydrolase (decyclizing) [Salinisphaera sp. Q1T1-3]|uniref:3D-(3,5/4)-trihydroxycyclohexane-1,2-dione acylhydrolase (decyclizing) n=1 Tax=Salinisphaera sp. Q1T1-3 TaxID=2321229 RepID=UPI000E74D82C|nr:3D-(3,5/4)-trihydroxycyclohexane-1,2-dione acylhydrolase (decyclizing) [Salinisphaera sp. Q1T1-3]RJS94775.1 3D-(3,5/4)-trihydroxycyclohexane-1,2-dione acylhydrolase (decyclizing) [Salinisphaera sp. Q1T1-3]
MSSATPQVETVRLTMAQALVRHLAAQYIEIDGQPMSLFGGCFAIFGHGNVAGMGEALYDQRDVFPTYRAHNEQGMTHAAIAFAKQHRRRRMMACTTSIGPGALNMVTAAGLAHANRLPVLLLPGDTFATRQPDPVLQQVEHYGAPSTTVNDAFMPVSRYFDRINRPEQLVTSLPAAIATLLDPVDCGPATLALPQDVQAEAYDFPVSFFEPRVHRIRRPGLDEVELAAAVEMLRDARQPLLIAGGGVLYSDNAGERLAAFAEAHGVPVAETQAGKGSLRADHPANVGAIGVTGSTAANTLAEQADVIIALGTRLQDFTTGSRALYMAHGPRLLGINVARFDAAKHGAQSLVGDAGVALTALSQALDGWRAADAWQQQRTDLRRDWHAVVELVTADDGAARPADSQVLGAVNRAAGKTGTVVCAAGGLPGELHKLYQATGPGSYHVEYGFSCMGYEIAGGLGVKMAAPEREVYVTVGDGSYLMLNSELATSVMLGHKLIVVLLDNRGFGCIHRLQDATVGVEFNNLFSGCRTAPAGAPDIDFAAHAKALGCEAEWVDGIAGLEAALQRARAADKTYLIALKTDADKATAEGGTWWDVPVAEVSSRDAVAERRAGYDDQKQRQR